MSDYYDRTGAPISMERWCELYKQHDYQSLKVSRGNGVRVSTIWLGLDHSFGNGSPLIFETMVFPREEPRPTSEDPKHEDFRDIDGERYTSEAQALAGHARLCAKHGVRYEQPVEAAS